jgi:hypothetical protein
MQCIPFLSGQRIYFAIQYFWCTGHQRDIQFSFSLQWETLCSLLIKHLFMLFIFSQQGWCCILLMCVSCPLLCYTSLMHPYFFPLGEASSLFLCFFLIVIDLVFRLAELDSFYLNGPSSQLGLVPIYPGVKCVQK